MRIEITKLIDEAKDIEDLKPVLKQLAAILEEDFNIKHLQRRNMIFEEGKGPIWLAPNGRWYRMTLTGLSTVSTQLTDLGSIKPKE